MPATVLSGLSERASVTVRSLASWLGLAAIFGAAFAFTGQSPFPGYIALLPVLGTVLVIWAGTVEHRWAPTAVVGFGPVQLIGDLSYAIYLWHWPLIIVYPYLRGNEPEFKGGLLIIGASIVLAAATKYFIEDPVRTRQFWVTNRRRSYAFAAGGMAVILCLSMFGWAQVQRLHDAANEPLPPFAGQAQLSNSIAETLALSSWPMADQPADGQAGVPEWIEDNCVDVGPNDLERCSYGATSAERVAVVIGDSFATAYMPAIRRALVPAGWQIHVLTLGQCPIADVVVRSKTSPGPFVECDEHRAWAESAIERIEPDLVLGADAVVSTMSRLISDDSAAVRFKQWSDGVEHSYGRLAALDVPVVILGGPPQATCITERDVNPSECLKTPGEVDEALFLDHQQRTALDAGLIFIDTRPWFCIGSGTCPEQVGSTLVRADWGHLTGAFSSKLAVVLRDALEETVPSLSVGGNAIERGPMNPRWTYQVGVPF